STYFLYQTWAARPFAKEGEDVLNSLFVEEEGLSEESQIFNPIVMARNQIRQQVQNHLITNARIDYDFGKGFKFTARGGINTRGNRNESFYSSRTIQGYPYNNNLRGVNGDFSDIQYVNWTNEEILNYTK